MPPYFFTLITQLKALPSLIQLIIGAGVFTASFRHRIIINDWQATHLRTFVAKLLDRTLLILNQINFSPKAIREDISGRKRYLGLLHLASELLDRGADISSEFAMLVHENERRWSAFRLKVSRLMKK
jgi:hypothetical protein